MHDGVDRRTFLTTSAAVGLGLGSASAGVRPLAAAPGPAQAGLFAAPPLETVRIGFIGLGHQGPGHLRNMLRIEGVEVKALCDIVPDRVARWQRAVVEAGRPEPHGYTGRGDWRRVCERDDMDLVYCATGWDLHAPICAEAMRNGKHAATEIPLAVTLDECWHLVETAERTRRHCVMMENCCYDRTEMMILNMVRQGLFGELLHAECGYLHDLRELKLTDYYVERWRVQHSIRRNGDLYPTHGLGPVAQWLDVNRGNRFDYLVSMATPSRGLAQWAAEHIGAASAEARQEYALGDVVNTLIRTARGATILLTHDTSSPRPYSRRILLQGTEGLIRKYPDQRIHVEGRSAAHQWEDAQLYREQFEHPVWKALEARAQGAGHGGMDFIEDFRLIHCLRAGAPLDMDVYDGAAWSAIAALSERSIATRQTVECPDFTNGAWRTRPPLGIVTI